MKKKRHIIKTGGRDFGLFERGGGPKEKEISWNSKQARDVQFEN